MEEKHVLTFGEFELSLEQKTLCRSGASVALTPKMFDLLSVLVENHGKVLDKEFLLGAVWPDSFVEESNISFNIRQLRKLLGDNVNSPLFIETIPRRGYRFIADVNHPTGEPALGNVPYLASEEASPTGSNGRGTLFIVALAAAILLIMSVGIGAWYVRARSSAPAAILSAPFSVEKLSTDGQVSAAAISPDGQTVVYVRRKEGRQSLWLKQLESSDITQILPLSESQYYGLTFAPDGKNIYFVRGTDTDESKQADIFRMSVFGGIPQKIIRDAQGWMSLGPDGKKMSFVRCPYAPEEYCSLWVADALDGSHERQLLAKPAPIRISDNKISPDGRTIVFASGQSRTASNEFLLSEVDIDTGTVREPSSEKFFNITDMSWLPSGSGVIMTARKQSDQNARIWYLALATGEAQPLTKDSQSYAGVSLNDEGSVLVSRQIEPTFHVKVYGSEDLDSPPVPVGTGTYLAFAPDGKLIISSMRSGFPAIWSIDADGGERLLTNDGSGNVTPLVSQDGNLIFYASNRTGEVQVWSMNRDGSGQTQVTQNGGGPPLGFMPDGHWLYYRSALQRTLRRVSLETGADELIWDKATKAFALSPDCNSIAVPDMVNGEGVFSIISLPSGIRSNSFKFAVPTESVANSVWTPDGKYLAYVLENEAGTRMSVYLQPTAGEKPRKVAELADEEGFIVPGFAFSPDGKRFAIAQGSWMQNAVLIKGLGKPQ